MRLKFVFIALLSAFIFSSCKKQDEVKRFVYDPAARLHIKEAKGLRAEETAQTMTWAEIVRAPKVAITWTEKSGSKLGEGMYFTGDLRDLANNKLLLPGDLLIGVKTNNQAYIDEGFVTSSDFCIYIPSADYKHRDTVAYIPNADRTAFMAEVRRLFNEGNSDAVYSLFRDSFKAKRITGKEWRELKAQGLN